jgi:hypothetical protein
MHILLATTGRLSATDARAVDRHRMASETAAFTKLQKRCKVNFKLQRPYVAKLWRSGARAQLCSRRVALDAIATTGEPAPFALQRRND